MVTLETQSSKKMKYTVTIYSGFEPYRIEYFSSLKEAKNFQKAFSFITFLEKIRFN